MAGKDDEDSVGGGVVPPPSRWEEAPLYRGIACGAQAGHLDDDEDYVGALRLYAKAVGLLSCAEQSEEHPERTEAIQARITSFEARADEIAEMLDMAFKKHTLELDLSHRLAVLRDEAQHGVGSPFLESIHPEWYPPNVDIPTCNPHPDHADMVAALRAATRDHGHRDGQWSNQWYRVLAKACPKSWRCMFPESWGKLEWSRENRTLPVTTDHRESEVMTLTLELATVKLGNKDGTWSNQWYLALAEACPESWAIAYPEGHHVSRTMPPPAEADLFREIHQVLSQSGLGPNAEVMRELAEEAANRPADRYTPSWKSTDTADSIEHVPSWTGPGPVDVDAAHDTLEERLAALREQP